MNSTTLISSSSDDSQITPNSKTIKIHTKIRPFSTDRNFSKSITFADDHNQPTSIPFPPGTTTRNDNDDDIIDDDSEENQYQTKINELGRRSLKYLHDIGIIRSNNNNKLNGNSPESSQQEEPGARAISNKKVYNCNLNFELTQGDEIFNVRFQLIYRMNSISEEKLPPNLYISNEELINYLRDKIIMREKNLHGIESKINVLLKLCSVRCFINDLELDC
ncbi:uncharacterized protein J8A68_004856 [[Candida] subhashii]|uniref:Uncharacterized protein n=1 Tax=[Candida] subhashii TaxID=561895 RepID=A0A8J5QGI2_9ASCO|nr:uncharacterized protein J8A68_004856 [[Candida] subhashii]KAG7661588.1 hypothetical protein J8A68_004856 [[Candida] subhashii]